MVNKQTSCQTNEQPTNREKCCTLSLLFWIGINGRATSKTITCNTQHATIRYRFGIFSIQFGFDFTASASTSAFNTGVTSKRKCYSQFCTVVAYTFSKDIVLQPNKRIFCISLLFAVWLSKHHKFYGNSIFQIFQ